MYDGSYTESPFVASFLLIGFFIWIAENVATLLDAWQYPNQQLAWRLVGLGKISAWFLLLVMITFLLVAQLKRVETVRQTQF